MSIRNRLVFYATVAAGLVAASSFAQERTTLRETAREIFGVIEAPTGNDIRDSKSVLDRALFWDTRLSVNGEVACASCHAAEAWGADRRRFSINARGAETSRHSQSVFNAQHAAAGLRWVGDRASGAAQALGSITGSMGFASRTDIVPVLLEHGYATAFARAFPDDADPVSPQNYAVALEAYQLTLTTTAAFDRWLEGDDSAMTDLAVRGLERFISVGCAACHNGPLLGGTSVQRFGVVENYSEHTGSTVVDDGLMLTSGNEEDRFKFRVQPLRNVARTAPYFHDGSVDDLAVATAVMARVQLGLTLADSELEELVAFQEALTGEVPRHYAAPAA